MVQPIGAGSSQIFGVYDNKSTAANGPGKKPLTIDFNFTDKDGDGKLTATDLSDVDDPAFKQYLQDKGLLSGNIKWDNFVYNAATYIKGFFNRGTTATETFDGTTVTTTYDKDGNATRTVSENIATGNREVCDSKYDKAGNVTYSHSVRTEDGETYTEDTYNTYDESGNLRRVVSDKTDSEGSYTCITEYRENGNFSHYKETRDGKLIADISYDINGHEISNAAETVNDDAATAEDAEDTVANDIVKKLLDKNITMDMDKLADIYSRFDFDIDEDHSGTITEDEITRNGGSKEYLNKDKSGKYIPTSFADYIVNMYIHQTQE